LVER
jgi:hypothetical protein